MRRSVIKSKLNRNQPVLLTQLHFTDPSVFELTSLMGFDGIWMDLEHHGYSVQHAAAMMRAARIGNADIMARAAKGEFARAARLFEAGAQGIMYPRCDNAAEAAEVVKWTKFPPIGKRGFDGGNPDMPYCTMPMDQYIKAANDETFIVIQIEEQDALQNAEQIAEVEGVDLIFLGPADFSVLSGFPGQFDHPLMLDALKRVAAAAQKAGKHWGTPGFSPEHIKRLLDMGARMICYGADLLILKNGLEQVQQDLAPLGFTFDSKIATDGQSYLEDR